jgi:hypothetical protein
VRHKAQDIRDWSLSHDADRERTQRTDIEEPHFGSWEDRLEYRKDEVRDGNRIDDVKECGPYACSVENKQQKSEGCEDEKGSFGGSQLFMKREAARLPRDTLGFTIGLARAQPTASRRHVI